ENDVLRFGENLDVITVELENVCVPALETLERRGATVRPSPQTLRIVQDKGLQKQFLEQHGFPTAPFAPVNDERELQTAVRRFGAAVVKLRRGGYDGKGVIFDLSEPLRGPSIVEQKIAVERELSVVAVRSPGGETRVYDPVETFFHPEAKLVEKLVCPAALADDLRRQAQELTLNIADKLQHVGVMAVEFFLDGDERLWVNEISPRPHNTGHHTIEACWVSQFEQHLRAILDLPLGDSTLRSPAAMLNILGVRHGPPRYRGLREILSIAGVKVHLYGKKIATPHRKLGHITVLGDDYAQIARKLEVIAQNFAVV
ncbi:MAG: ATP-grasp domain-containing protein, partial [Bacteroidia bacterium]|nr:ATP-grasp domain-containing protein [Bacteroidia bacterium]